jgi:hypothetical protein
MGKHMKNTLIILIFFLFEFQTSAQEIEFYNLSFKADYLPSCVEKTEMFKKSNSQIVHEKFERNDDCMESNIVLENDSLIEKQINQLDSLFKLKEFTFLVANSFVDSLKARTIYKSIYKVTEKDIDAFFCRGDTITINLKKIRIKKDKSFIFDGIHYKFELTLKRHNQDTLRYQFSGNLFDIVTQQNIKDWLPMYLIYRKFKLFTSIEFIDNYFLDSNLENYIYWYISVNK